MAKQKVPVIIIILLCSLVYANTLFNGFALDDKAVITENTLTQKGAAGIADLVTHDHFYGYRNAVTGLYRPVPLVTHAIEFELFGINPFVGHLVNLLLYIMVCVALFFMLTWMFSEANYLLPLVVVSLFAVHPLHTEIVANIKGRDEMLNLLFIALSAISVFTWIRRSATSYYFLALFFFLFALLSKESAMTFLAVIPLMLWYFTKAGYKKILVVFAGLAGVAMLYIMIRASFVSSAAEYRFLDGYHQYCSSRADRLATSIGSLLDYIKLLIFPFPLVYDYSYNTIHVISWTNPKVLISLFVSTGLIIFAFIKLPRKNLLSYCILTFYLTLSVFANIITPTSAIFGERFLFIPSLAFCMAVGWAIITWLKIPVTGPVSLQKIPIARRTLFIAVAALILMVFAGFTIHRNKAWKDDFTLFSTDLPHLPDNARANFNLATWYANKIAQNQSNPDPADASQAIRYFNNTVTIDSGFTEAYFMAAALVYNQNNFREAARLFTKAAETATKSTPPEYSPQLAQKYAGKAWYNLGVAAFKKSEFSDARDCFKKSAALDPSNAFAMLNIASSYFNLHQFDSAAVYYNLTLAIKPDDADAWHGLGLTAISRKNNEEAIRCFMKALALDPSRRATYKKMGMKL